MTQDVVLQNKGSNEKTSNDFQSKGSERGTEEAMTKNLGQEPKKFAFAGYEVGGWGALLAFLISIVTLSLTAFDRWFLDANPVLHLPVTINFTCKGWYQEPDANGKLLPAICPKDGKLFVAATPFTIVNDTSAPHSFTVVESSLVLNFLDQANARRKSVKLFWFYFSQNEDVTLVTLGPQQNFSKEVDYYPRKAFDSQGMPLSENFLPFRDFEKVIALEGIHQIEMIFTIDFLERNSISRTCYVPIDSETVADANKATKVLHSTNCFLNKFT
jgi:hypothetical protein